ncbi:MAG: hypothetical protein KF729_12125 [Sandaracinaceae bacterium]|nr:hypothetical protein [Sandaracinaceae bacterium]
MRVVGFAWALGGAACAPAGGESCDGGRCAPDAGAPDERLARPPATCGAPVGGECSANADCDLGLECGEGACRCTGPVCTLACYEGAKPDRLRVAGGRLFYLLEREAGDWELVSLAALDGASATLAAGVGHAALALHDDEIVVAFEPSPGRTQVDRMALDGSGRTELLPGWGLPLPFRWLTVSDDELLLGRDREVYAVPRAGGAPLLVAGGLSVNVPRWFVVEGRQLYWVNDDIDSVTQPDHVMTVSLDDVEGTLRIHGQANGIREMISCGGEIVFTDGDAVYRLVREAVSTTWFSPGSLALGCQSDAVLATELGEGNTRALARRSILGLAETLLTVPLGGALETDSLAAAADHVVWTTASGGPWRVLRMEAPSR